MEASETSLAGQREHLRFQEYQQMKENLLSYLRQTPDREQSTKHCKTVAVFWNLALSKFDPAALTESQITLNTLRGLESKLDTRLGAIEKKLQSGAHSTHEYKLPSLPTGKIIENASFTSFPDSTSNGSASGITRSSWASIAAKPGAAEPWTTVLGAGSKRERDTQQREETKALNKARTVVVKIPSSEDKTATRTTGREKIFDQLKRLIPEACVIAVDILASGDVRITCAHQAGRAVCVAEETKWISTISSTAKIAKPTFPVMVHGVRIAGLNLADHAKVAKTIEHDNSSNIPGLQILHVKWLKSQAAMVGQSTSSIVLDVSSAEHANSAIINQLVINGELLRTELYDLQAETVHCFKCLGYGHIAKVCKAPDACRWCGGKHRASTCDRSRTDKTGLWCKNCRSKGHGAQTRECPREQAEKKRTKLAIGEKSYLFATVPTAPVIDLTVPHTQVLRHAKKQGRPVTGAATNVSKAAGYGKSADNASRAPQTVNKPTVFKPADNNQRTLQDAFSGTQQRAKRLRSDSGPPADRFSPPDASFSFQKEKPVAGTPPTSEPATTFSQDFSETINTDTQQILSNRLSPTEPLIQSSAAPAQTVPDITGSDTTSGSDGGAAVTASDTAMEEEL